MKQIIVKKALQAALKSEYGFKPALDDITIYKTVFEEDRPVFACFMVNGKEYRFKSYISHIGGSPCLWVGSGTIEKVRYEK